MGGPLLAETRRRVLLGIAIVAMLGAGTMYTWSVFVPSLQDEFMWDAGQTSLVFTVCVVTFNIGCFLSGTLHDKLGLKPIMLASVVLMGTGLYLCSHIQTHLDVLLRFGVAFGMGAGMIYNSLLGELVRWYPDQSGTCSGVMLLGFGLGSLVYGQLTSAVIAALGWRGAFQVLCGLVVASAALAAILVRAPRREELEQLPIRTATETDEELDEGVNTAGMLRDGAFWLYQLRAIALLAGSLAVMGSAVPIGIELGMLEGAAVLASGVISVFNGGSRLLMGILFDRLGIRRTMMLDGALFVAAFSLLLAAASTGIVALVWAGFVVLGLAFGGLASNHPVFVLSTFGARNYSMNLGTFALVNSLCSPVSQLMGGSLAAFLGGYAATFPVLLGAAVAGFAMTFILAGRVRD